ncbi:DUF4845 domain-containing protein [Marinobacterium rhizophilum]|uniref:DUF4845 domain-containing protein n=1 Tax=Marinobacterium rhizophilum TaxID=420402 RepID=UPI000367FC0A|nr:DUF4845 domain-containing protein [Marinobacterium rhizophilum]
MIKAAKREQGASFVSILIVMIMVGVFLAVGFKLFTPYKDHATVKSILENVIYDPDLVGRDSRSIRSTISSRATINQVRTDLSREDFLKIENIDGKIHFDLVYEERVPMFYNVDAVVKFNEHYEVIKP